MTTLLRACALLPLLASFQTGCAYGQTDDADLENELENEGTLGVAESAIEGSNALNLNALNLNALNLNALNLNALNLNALDPAALTTLTAPDATGDLARQLMKYTASCALDATQSMSFSWTDSAGVAHPESYPGLLGLATTWATQPLNVVGQQWVSACLASRVNWYGVSVMLSSRASHPGLNKTGTPELTTYTKQEGAFWGNLFAATPAVYSCNYGPNVAYSRSKQRDCAAGHLDASGNAVDCGMLHVAGSCSALCDDLDSKGLFYKTCGASTNSADATKKVITVFLQ